MGNTESAGTDSHVDNLLNNSNYNEDTSESATESTTDMFVSAVEQSESESAIEQSESAIEQSESAIEQSESTTDIFKSSIEETEPIVPETIELETIEPEPIVPETIEPEPIVPVTIVPETIVPETIVPETIVPEPIVPVTIVPEPIVPVTIVPETIVPETIVPETIMSQINEQYVHPIIDAMNNKCSVIEMIGTLNSFCGVGQIGTDEFGNPEYEYVDQMEYIAPVTIVFAEYCMRGNIDVTKWIIDNFIPLQVSHDNNICFRTCIQKNYIEISTMIAKHDSFEPTIAVLDIMKTRKMYDLILHCLHSPLLIDNLYQHKDLMIQHISSGNIDNFLSLFKTCSSEHNESSESDESDESSESGESGDVENMQTGEPIQSIEQIEADSPIGSVEPSGLIEN